MLTGGHPVGHQCGVDGAGVGAGHPQVVVVARVVVDSTTTAHTPPALGPWERSGEGEPGAAGHALSLEEAS